MADVKEMLVDVGQPSYVFMDAGFVLLIDFVYVVTLFTLSSKVILVLSCYILKLPSSTCAHFLCIFPEFGLR